MHPNPKIKLNSNKLRYPRINMLHVISLLFYLSFSVNAFTSNPTVRSVQDRPKLFSLADKSGEEISAKTKYKTDINALNQLLDSKEEAKLEEVKKLVQEIQDLRRKNPKVAIPRKVREALASYHNAETKYGTDSREAKIAYSYFVDICHAKDMHPDHHIFDSKDESDSAHVLDEALNAVHVLEELKEIAHVEKAILDRFGTTDFEIGEGLLEREIGRADDDTYGMWV